MATDKNDIFNIIKQERNDIANIYSAFRDFPEGVAAHYFFYKRLILSEPLPLSRLEREFLAVETSKANQCPYCVEHHSAAMKKVNRDVPQERSKALQKIAKVLTKDMWKSSLIKEEFLSAGFSHAEWQHAVMIVAYFNFSNRCAHAMNLHLEDNFVLTCN